MGYLSEFLDSMAYGASKQTAENAQRDLQDLDNKMAQRAITPQVYEEEKVKIRNTLNTVLGNAQKYADSLNASEGERIASNIEKDKVDIDIANKAFENKSITKSTYDDVIASRESSIQSGEKKISTTLSKLGFSPETIDSFSPEERAQFASGYQPPKVERVTAAKVAAAAAPSTGQAIENAPDYVRVSNKAVNKPIRTWQDYIEAQPTAGDKYEAERQFANQHRQKSMIEILNQAQQVPPELRKDWIEQSRMMLDLKTPAMADIRESKFFKTTEAEAGKAGHLQSELTLSMMHNELSTAKVLLAEVKRLGDSSEGKTKRGQLISFLEANLPKVMQSIATGQSDAVQLSEANRLLPEVTTFFEKSPKDWAELIKLRGGFFKAFSLDVEGFMDKAELIYKAGAGAQNSIYDKAHGKLGKAIEDTGLRRFNDTINPGVRAKSDVQDIQNRLKGFQITPVYNQNPFSESQKPVMNQTGQSPLPSSAPPLRKGKVLNFGQTVKQVTNFQPLFGQD